MLKKKVLVTGSNFFLNRHRFLFDEMADHLNGIDYISSSDRTMLDKLELSVKAAFFALMHSVFMRDIPLAAVFDKFTIPKDFQKSSLAFVTKSRQTEKKISQLNCTPDLIFQVFCLSSPVLEKLDIPYCYYLDYTTKLAKKIWSPWSPLDSEYDDWINCERRAYQNALHLFPMSEWVKVSLIEDYGISPSKITVVGSSGNFFKSYEGKKKFGTQRILFNGSDFGRKNGELVLSAFKIVRQILPDAKLVIIGGQLETYDEGVSNPGHISISEVQNLFLETDLLVSPAYCDPFPGLLIEAMNYGVPCIVSAVDGMPEIVDHNRNGLVIPQPTPEVLAHEITNLLNDPARLNAMSQDARDKVKAKLNWNYVAQKILSVLETI